LAAAAAGWLAGWLAIGVEAGKRQAASGKQQAAGLFFLFFSFSVLCGLGKVNPDDMPSRSFFLSFLLTFLRLVFPLPSPSPSLDRRREISGVCGE
jgi:hypothetical protein